MSASVPIEPVAFHRALARFQGLVAAHGGGHAFSGFQTGVVGAWENYKPRLREHALGILAIDRWGADEIGSGRILMRVISAIEIQDASANLTNNLVSWQNRFGHANRDHRVLLEAQTDVALRHTVEQLLFELYRGGADEGAVFDSLSKATAAKYPLLAYLFFLKDIDRFLPIQPTTFDRAFKELGIQLVTSRNCVWENYTQYLAAVAAVQDALADALHPMPVRLIDAHSFCWMLIKLHPVLDTAIGPSGSSTGRIFDDWERSVVEMRMSVEQTVRNSNGQTIEQTVKVKELLMTPVRLEARITALLKLQQYRCALTGIPLDPSLTGDKNVRPSLDRIDSSMHYEEGNVQVVCRFINFWKGASDNEEFKRLLTLVRGVDG